MLGQQALGLLALERRLPPGVPAPVEPAPVALPPVGRGLVGRVAGARREVEEPGAVDVDVAQVLDVLDGPVHQVGGQVVAVVDAGRGLDVVAVVDQGGYVLVGLAAEEAVPALEALGQRPAIPSGGHVLLVLGGEVPLAHRVGGVAVGGEHGRGHGARVGDAGVVAGEAGGQVDDAAHAHPVVVAPGQHAGPGGGAQGGGVEVGVAQPAGGQAVEGGGVEVGAEAAQLGEAHVVEHDEQHVGRALGRRRLGRPPGLAVPVVATDAALELVGLHGVSPAALRGTRVIGLDRSLVVRCRSWSPPRRPTTDLTPASD